MNKRSTSAGPRPYDQGKRHSQIAADRNHNTPPVQTMITTYEESVLAHTDENGCLPPAIANQLIQDHYLCMADYLEETRDTKFHASELLNWLGY